MVQHVQGKIHNMVMVQTFSMPQTAVVDSDAKLRAVIAC